MTSLYHFGGKVALVTGAGAGIGKVLRPGVRGQRRPRGGGRYPARARRARRGGHSITFRQFLAYGVPVTFASALVASLWVWLCYLA